MPPLNVLQAEMAVDVAPKEAVKLVKAPKKKKMTRVVKLARTEEEDIIGSSPGPRRSTRRRTTIVRH